MVREHRGKVGEKGYTVVELLVSVGLMMILAQAALYGLKDNATTTQDVARQVSEFLQMARFRAIESVTTWEVKTNGNMQLRAAPVAACGGNELTTRPPIFVSIPVGFEFQGSVSSWRVCFSSRGFADAPVTLGVGDKSGHSSQQVRVLLSGTSDVTPSSPN